MSDNAKFTTKKPLSGLKKPTNTGDENPPDSAPAPTPYKEEELGK